MLATVLSTIEGLMHSCIKQPCESGTITTIINIPTYLMERLSYCGVKWLAQVPQLIRIVTKLLSDQDGKVGFTVSMFPARRLATRALMVQLMRGYVSWGAQRGGVMGRPPKRLLLWRVQSELENWGK